MNLWQIQNSFFGGGGSKTLEKPLRKHESVAEWRTGVTQSRGPREILQMAWPSPLDSENFRNAIPYSLAN